MREWSSLLKDLEDDVISTTGLLWLHYLWLLTDFTPPHLDTHFLTLFPTFFPQLVYPHFFPHFLVDGGL